MTFTDDLTHQATFRQYLREIGQVPSYHLEKCFACGLPAAWLYMRVIGMEELYFDILKKVKERSIWFRELFYLLLFTNKNNPFFPCLPDNVLNVDLPPEYLAAQVEMPPPEFQLAYSFTREQLIDTLQSLALPGKLIRLGNKQKAIAIMRNDNVGYAVYHADNPRAVEFNSIEKCVDLVIRTINGE